MPTPVLAYPVLAYLLCIWLHLQTHHPFPLRVPSPCPPLVAHPVAHLVAHPVACTDHTEAEDLLALRYLTTFRVPIQVHEQIPEIIAKVIESDGQWVNDASTPVGGTHTQSTA